MFLDASEYPFTRELERNSTAIRAEFEALAPDDFMAWPEKFLCAEGWTCSDSGPTACRWRRTADGVR